MKIIEYKPVFELLVQKTQEYVVNNNLKAMILGISGGIDSTVCAAICYEVSKHTGIPLIGRSLPTKYNKEGEITTADLVGKAFCNDYKVFGIDLLYRKVGYDIAYAEGLIDLSSPFDFEVTSPKQTPIANGNIQARLRMIYLYNLASIYNGIVIDTDNLTEHNLGYWTLHGDVGDFNPIGGLWKTEVFELAKYLHEYYSIESHYHENYSDQLKPNSNYSKCVAISKSLELKPTAGLGITNDDLEELGAESYDQVDAILQEILAWKTFNRNNNISYANKEDEKEAFLKEQQMLVYPIEIVSAVASRHFSSEFKRAKLPVVIERISYLI